MDKGLSNFQIDKFSKNEENKGLKKLYGNLFNRFNNQIYTFL